MFNFITKRPLWVNIIAAAVLTFLLLFLFLKMLGWITKHDAYLQVPSLLGKKTDEAVKILEKQGFEVQIQDSVFTDTAARGVVLKQLPDANAKVKINRTVFLTVNRVTPPMVDMPNLVGQSLNSALGMLKRYHLVLGDTIFKPYFGKNSIMEQLYNGKAITEKTKIQWGSKITLIVGLGLGDKEILVPSVLGMTYGDAKVYLDELGIVIGAPLADPDVRDTANAFVYYQNPPQFDEDKKPRYIKSGQFMDLRLSVERKSLTDSIDIKKQK